MGKTVFLIFLSFSLALSCLGQATAEELAIRPYGRIGYTLAPPSPESMDYDSEFDDTYSNLNYGAGAQVVANLSALVENLSVGGDLGFLSIYSAMFELGSADDDSYTRWDEWEGSAYLLALAEYGFLEHFFVQAGPGLFYRFWETNYEHTTDGTVSDWDDWSGSVVSFGISASFGLDLPIADTVGFFAAARLDFIFAHGVVVPFSALAGVSFHVS